MGSHLKSKKMMVHGQEDILKVSLKSNVIWLRKCYSPVGWGGWSEGGVGVGWGFLSLRIRLSRSTYQLKPKLIEGSKLTLACYKRNAMCIITFSIF